MRNEPMFVPGEMVMVRGVTTSAYDTDCTQVVAVTSEILIDAITNERMSGFHYQTAHQPDNARWWREESLRKLPPETPATFDAAIWQPSEVRV